MSSSRKNGGKILCSNLTFCKSKKELPQYRTPFVFWFTSNFLSIQFYVSMTIDINKVTETCRGGGGELDISHEYLDPDHYISPKFNCIYNLNGSLKAYL
jgi:hypothetical protein